jgi:archaellum component FlaC
MGMKDKLTQLDNRTNNLAEKLTALTHLADEVTNMLNVVAGKEQHVLMVNVDEDGDFVCSLYGETITLLTPHDVLTLAGWLDAVLHSATPQVAQEIEEAEQKR